MLKSLIMIFLTVILITLSLPPFEYSLLAWIALFPFFLLLLRSRQKILVGVCFGCSLAAVIGGFALTLYNLSLSVRLAFYLTFILLQGILYGVYGYIVEVIDQKFKKDIPVTLMIVFIWGSLEALTSKVFWGFTLNLGLSQYKNLRLLALTPYGGLVGISMLIVLTNISLVQIYLMIKEREKWMIEKLLFCIVPLIILFVLLPYQTNFVDHSIDSERSIKVALILPAYTGVTVGEIRNSAYTLQEEHIKYYRLSEEALQKGAELVIWPELAIDHWMMRLTGYRDGLEGLARLYSGYLLIGTVDLNEAGEEFNTAFLISPTGKITGRYDKQILVPFLEKEFTRGRKSGLFTVEETKMGILLCYESLFLEVWSDFAKEGVGTVLILSSNGMTGLGIIPYLHSAFSVVRAAQFRVYVIQIMKNGIVQLVGPKGQILEYSGIKDRIEDSIIFFDLPI